MVGMWVSAWLGVGIREEGVGQTRILSEEMMA